MKSEDGLSATERYGENAVDGHFGVAYLARHPPGHAVDDAEGLLVEALLNSAYHLGRGDGAVGSDDKAAQHSALDTFAICACRIAALAVDEFHHGSVAARKMGLFVDRLEQKSLYVDRPVVGADRAVGDDHALLSADTESQRQQEESDNWSESVHQ